MLTPDSRPLSLTRPVNDVQDTDFLPALRLNEADPANQNVRWTIARLTAYLTGVLMPTPGAGGTVLPANVVAALLAATGASATNAFLTEAALTAALATDPNHAPGPLKLVRWYDNAARTAAGGQGVSLEELLALEPRNMCAGTLIVVENDRQGPYRSHRVIFDGAPRPLYSGLYVLATGNFEPGNIVAAKVVRVDAPEALATPYASVDGATYAWQPDQYASAYVGNPLTLQFFRSRAAGVHPAPAEVGDPTHWEPVSPQSVPGPAGGLTGYQKAGNYRAIAAADSVPAALGLLEVRGDEQLAVIAAAFLPLLASELNADKQAYVGLGLRAALLRLINTGPGGTAAPAANEVDVLLLLGQSNLLGVGDLSHFQDPTRTVYSERGELVASFANQQMMDYANATPGFYPLVPGVNNASINYPGEAVRPGKWFGAELGLATRYRAAQPGRTLYQIKIPIDGQALTSYNEGTNGWNRLSSSVARANTYFSSIGKTPKYAVLLVHGEADFSTGNNNYGADLEVFFNRIRAINGLAANGRIAVSGVRSQGSPSVAPQILAWVSAQQKAFVNADPANRRFIDTENYTARADANDVLHYDSAGQYHLGNRDAYNAIFNATGGWQNPGTSTAPPATGELTVLGTNPNLFFFTAWQIQGNAATVDASNTFAGLTFDGTALYVDTPAGPNAIKMDVYVDNVFRGTVNVPTGTAAPLAQRLAVTGLSAGTHSAKFISRAGYTGTLAYLERIRITSGEVLPYAGGNVFPQAAAIENTFSDFRYAGLANEGGGWSPFNVPAASEGSLHYTGPGANSGLPATVLITGTEFDYWAPRWGFDCRTRIFVDDVFAQEVVVAAGDEVSAIRYTHTGMTPGNHTLSFYNVIGTGTMAIVDRITTR